MVWIQSVLQTFSSKPTRKAAEATGLLEVILSWHFLLASEPLRAIIRVNHWRTNVPSDFVIKTLYRWILFLYSNIKRKSLTLALTHLAQSLQLRFQFFCNTSSTRVYQGYVLFLKSSHVRFSRFVSPIVHLTFWSLVSINKSNLRSERMNLPGS